MARVIKTIGGRAYYYDQRSFREGGKVKTVSKYVGPVRPRRRAANAFMDGVAAGFVRQQFTSTHGIDWDAVERQQVERTKAEDATYAAKLNKLHEKFGLKLGPANPVPINAHEAPAPVSEQSVSAASSEQSLDGKHDDQ